VSSIITAPLLFRFELISFVRGILQMFCSGVLVFAGVEGSQCVEPIACQEDLEDPGGMA